jgi:hypothetical protein
LVIVGPFSKVLEQEFIPAWPPQPPRGGTSAPSFCPQARAYSTFAYLVTTGHVKPPDKNCVSLRPQRLTWHCALAPASTRSQSDEDDKTDRQRRATPDRESPAIPNITRVAKGYVGEDVSDLEFDLLFWRRVTLPNNVLSCFHNSLTLWYL